MVGPRDQRRPRKIAQDFPVSQRELEVGERQVRMLTREAFGPHALTALDRLDQPGVMTVGDHQDLARLRELGLCEHERRAGAASGRDTIPASARSSIGLRASLSSRAWKLSLRLT